METIVCKNCAFLESHFDTYYVRMLYKCEYELSTQNIPKSIDVNTERPGWCPLLPEEEGRGIWKRN